MLTLNRFHRHAMDLVFAVALVALLTAGLTPPAWAQSENVGRSEHAAGALGGTGAAANLPVMPMGLAFVLPAPVATATGTGEQVLGTYTLPANALDVVGRTLRVTAGFSTAANTNTKTPKLYVGAMNIAPAGTTTSAAPITAQMLVTKTGPSTQSYSAWSVGGAAGVTPLNGVGTGTETDTAGIVIKASCTDATSAAADCTLVTLTVEYLN